jgi:predicted AAA+ superfamily ATPase
MQSVFEQIIADDQEREWPELIARDTPIREHKGKVSVVLGMRRVGKTSLCWQKMRELADQGVPRRCMLYVNFEDERLLPFEPAHFQQLLDVYYRMCPEATLKEHYLFLDEPQRIAGWELFVRRLLEESRARLFITGSSAKLLGREIATALRGRALSTELFPLRFGEYLRFQNIPGPKTSGYSTRDRALLAGSLEGYLRRGGFPEVQTGTDAICRDILRGYVDVVLLRDVIERHNVSNVAALRALLRQLLQAPGALFSVNKFHGQLKSMGIPIAKNSLYDFIAYLADAYLIYPVELHTRSAKKRQVNPNKMYVADTGLLNAHGMGLTADRGPFMENLVYMELRARGLSVDYVVTSKVYEVDFLAGAEQGRPELLQVCWSLEQRSTADREIRALTDALDNRLAPSGKIITFSSTTPPFLEDKRIQVVPAYRWLLEKDAL